MRLCDALDLRENDVATFVGGGGKTAAMFRLAAELGAAGRFVVATTTTRIFAEQMRHAPRVFVDEPIDAVLRQLPEASRSYPFVLVVGAMRSAPAGGVVNACGIEPDDVGRMATRSDVFAVVVEGDGSRGRSLKAPADHEPVVPASTTVLIPVVGIDVLGRPLTDAYVHRADHVVRLIGITEGNPITAAMVADVIVSPHGGRKRQPAGSRCIPLINKVHTTEQQAAAHDVARRMLDSGDVHGVCIGAVAGDDPIHRMLTP